jgi:hypothetical protein
MPPIDIAGIRCQDFENEKRTKPWHHCGFPPFLGFGPRQIGGWAPRHGLIPEAVAPILAYAGAAEEKRGWGCRDAAGRSTEISEWLKDDCEQARGLLVKD